MNIRTFYLLILFLVGTLFIQNSFAGLSRPLNDKQVKKLKSNLVKNPNNFKSRKFLAEHYELKSNWVMVISTLSPYAETIPEESLHLLIRSYLQQGNFKQANSLIKVSLSQKTVTIASYQLAIQIYMAQASSQTNKEMQNETVELLFSLLKIANQNYPTEEKIYDLWFESLEFFVPHFQYEALRVLEDMKNNDVDFEQKHYSLLCKYNHLAGYGKQAKESCNTAIEKDPTNPQNIIFLGQTHLNTGEKSTGLRMLSSVGEKFSNSEEALWTSANTYYENKNLIKSYEYFKKATLHKERQARDYLGLAKVSFELKKYKEALSAFTKNCQMTQFLHHEFRLASGLLKTQSRWQKIYRNRMLNCKKK